MNDAINGLFEFNSTWVAMALYYSRRRGSEAPSA